LFQKEEMTSIIALSVALKEGTHEEHQKTERHPFIGRFRRELTVPQYGRMLGNFFFIYTALEEALEKNKDHNTVQFVYHPQLNRIPKLLEDLEFYYGPDWRNEIKMSPGTELYVNRIRELAISDPTLLIAHSYTRYLGDLSGGQILKRMITRTLQLEDQGHHFYDFDDIHPSTFKNLYREKLDQITDQDTIQSIVNEAKAAFNMNAVVFSDLEAQGAL
jgi:heme oxygenase